MDIEKLIEQLHNFEACAYGYHINGEVLGVDCSDFEQVMVDAAEEISKIPTLQAENERLKNKLSELAHLPFDEPGIGERTRLMAENAELRAELEQARESLDFARTKDAEIVRLGMELEQVKRENETLKHALQNWHEEV